MMNEELLFETELVPDPDEAQEMGAQIPQLIGDQDLRGCRLLLVSRAVQPFQADSLKGLAVELSCAFQPALNSRFTWAQIVLDVLQPSDARFFDVGPEAVREGEPVRFTLDSRGKLGVKYTPLSGEIQDSEKQEFSIYHCDVQGSGAGTAKARWDFRENPHTAQGLGPSQPLTFVLPQSPRYILRSTISARIVRAGLHGAVDAARSLIGRPDKRTYPFELDFPPPGGSKIARFLFGK
jgi:hypothetical protein